MSVCPKQSEPPKGAAMKGGRSATHFPPQAYSSTFRGPPGAATGAPPRSDSAPATMALVLLLGLSLPLGPLAQAARCSPAGPTQTFGSLAEFQASNASSCAVSVNFSAQRFEGDRLPPLRPSGAACLLALELRNKSLARLADGAFANLTCLGRLDLSQNRLAALSKRTFQGLDGLLALNLSGNALIGLAAADLQPLPRLRLLDVSFNRLVGVDREAFNASPALRALNASHNQLKRMPDCFDALPELRELSLDHNSIAIFSAQALSGNSALRRLDFMKNEMVILHFGENETFSWPELRLLNLSGNCLGTVSVNRAHALFGNSAACLDLNDNHFSCAEWQRLAEGLARGGVCVRPGRDWGAPHHIQGMLCDKAWAQLFEAPPAAPPAFHIKYLALALALIGAAFVFLLVRDRCAQPSLPKWLCATAPSSDMDYVHLQPDS
ncbi:toll-like receptor Tollo isoform X1 [Dendroctonus ponderosae]|nr:toll-like receptor Tollo isoform X1 [Dendroctonus ponderosae]